MSLGVGSIGSRLELDDNRPARLEVDQTIKLGFRVTKHIVRLIRSYEEICIC